MVLSAPKGWPTSDYSDKFDKSDTNTVKADQTVRGRSYKKTDECPNEAGPAIKKV